MLKTEDNLRKYKPHLKVYQIPEDQMIRATGEECIVTSYKPGSNPAADSEGLFTLVTIWTPKEGKLKAKPVKVDFRPHFGLKSIVVDVNDNVIICMEKPEENTSNVNKEYEWRIRAIHLFNKSDIGRSWPFEEVITTEAGVEESPKVKLGREGLFLMHTSHKTMWTKWHNGNDATWSTIETPFFDNIYSAEIYGPDILVILGKCMSPNLVGASFRTEFHSNQRDYLFIYKIDDNSHHMPSTPHLILRLPWARNEWSHCIREVIPHTEPGEAAFNPLLSNSNNGRSAVVEVAYQLLDDSGQTWPDASIPWATISLPLTAIRNMLEDVAPSSGRQENPHRAVRTTSTVVSTRPEGPPEGSDPMCKCCVIPEEPTEQLGIDVMAPRQWRDKAYMSYWRAPADMPNYPRLCGTKIMEYFRLSQDLTKTDGQILTELHVTNYNIHDQYELGNHKALGGLGQKLKLPKAAKDTGRLRVSGLITWSSPSKGPLATATQTQCRGHFKKTPAKGLIKNVIFNGEKLIFEHVGWITVLDFA